MSFALISFLYINYDNRLRGKKASRALRPTSGAIPAAKLTAPAAAQISVAVPSFSAALINLLCLASFPSCKAFSAAFLHILPAIHHPTLPVVPVITPTPVMA